mgnify:CR=1 FL=1
MYAADEIKKEMQEVSEGAELFKQLTKEEKIQVKGMMLGFKLARENLSNKSA